MGLNRRTFLQQVGLALLTLGVSEAWLSSLGNNSLAAPWVNRYFQTLAQPTARKLALLVGINNYPQTPNLSGCVTDVELQRELLIHRFGFKSGDILTLTDQQATREDIETAFVEHLVEQAVEGDVVVFHFSGYGSRVKIPQSLDAAATQAEEEEKRPYRLENSLVPVDGILRTKGTPAVNDLLEETLVLLARSLATDKVTMILDTSYRGTDKVLHGNLRVRSRPTPPAERPSPEELAFQEKLLLRSNSAQEILKQPRSLEQIPGIVLAAAGESQIAAEGQWNGFSTGLFTYALTQYLWQATPASTVHISLTQAAQTVERVMGKQQQPQLIDNPTRKQPLLTYYLLPNPQISADGVVMAVEDDGKTAQLRLAGLPATLLSDYGINSRLTVVSGQAEAQPVPVPNSPESDTAAEVKPAIQEVQLQIRSREGLTAKARLVDQTVPTDYQLEVGQLVQEAIRVLKRNPGLTVALDADLQRIERVDATSAFANVSAVSLVVTAGEQSADCLFGRVEESQSAAIDSTEDFEEDEAFSLGGYGLFSIGRVPIPSTAGVASEAVKSAVNRLVPKLEVLLAAKLWRLTINEGSSHLGVRATLETIDPQNQKLIERETERTVENGKNDQPSISLPLSDARDGVPNLSVGSRIQYQLENYSNRPIYMMLVGLDSSGNAIALYSPHSSSESDNSGSKPKLKNTLVAPGETLIVPESSASFNWIVPGPAGLAEIQLVCSREPFTKTLETLSAIEHPKGEGERVVDLLNPLEVALALLQDLHTASAVSPKITGSAADTYALDVNAWATLSFVYQVV